MNTEKKNKGFSLDLGHCLELRFKQLKPQFNADIMETIYKLVLLIQLLHVLQSLYIGIVCTQLSPHCIYQYRFLQRVLWFINVIFF